MQFWRRSRAGDRTLFAVSPSLDRDGFNWAREFAASLPSLDSMSGPVRNALELDPVAKFATDRQLHLDDCGPQDGPLRVVPGTHHATLTDDEVSAATHGGFITCVARRGDVLLMRPLLLHSSLKAASPSRRRVLHLEWAADPLPLPLRWRWTILPSP